MRARCWPVALAALVLAAFAVAGPISADPTGQITEVATGGTTLGFTANSSPDAITTGPDGNVWFTEDVGNRIGRITPAHAVTEFTSGITGSSLFDITAGPDGNLWFTEFGAPSKIAKITTGGAITEVATAGVTPGFSSTQVEGITRGPDGNLWFTEPFKPGIGRITPGGVVTEFTAGLTGDPRFIVAGSDGNLWFTEEGNPGIIAKITTTGTVTEVATGGVTPGFTVNSLPRHIALGSDGNLWFTEVSGSVQRIGRITTGGAVTEFNSGLTGGLQGIASGCDGNLWFTSTNTAAPTVGRITTVGTANLFTTGLAPGASTNLIASGPGQNMWITQRDDPGRIATVGACSAAAPPPPVVIQPRFTG